MQDMDWNDLRAFLAIAESSQIGRAAQRMKVDPTTLGRRIRRLENRLDTTLFERTREGQVLTEAGERLLAKTEIMALAAQSINEPSSTRRNLTGNLRLSVSEGFGSQFLSHYIPAFARSYPDLTVELAASSGFLSPSKREADIAVMLSRPKAGPVVARKLSDYTLGLYASREYLQRNGVPNAPDDLACGHAFVSYVPDLLYAPELNYLDEFHTGLTARIRSSSINAQHCLLNEAAGIGVLPHFIAAQSDSLIPVLPSHVIRRSFWIVTHRDTQNLARVRAGKEWLLQCVADGKSRLIPET